MAADMEATLDAAEFSFAKAVNRSADDAFDGKGYFLSRPRGLEENRWAATCPLCRLFRAVRVEGEGEDTLILPLALYHDDGQQRMCDFMRQGLLNGVPYVNGSWEAWKRLATGPEEPSTLSIFRAVDQHIGDYTQRQLTLDEDSLVPGDDSTRPAPPQARALYVLSTSFWHHEGDDEPLGLNHHYVSTKQLTRNDASSFKWTYSPDMVVLRPDGTIAYDFRSPGPPGLPTGCCYLPRVSDLVLDHVKARTPTRAAGCSTTLTSTRG
ncbi:Uncharacterized protein TCAP_03750 [Tolypocladium capitatum]|uniref:Uncharacterized protein n=1 Tax=Tolypocladium capitatum TaxID=45235 RepID=A0A2K3QFN1_9HYPO|nr:Uncharacterized protein TCAP_03750 [Tolypocladium capitatum]